MAYRNNNNRNVATASLGANTLLKTKKVRYGATADQIFSISEAIDSTKTTEPIPSAIEVINTGSVPVILATGYEDWTAASTSANDIEYLHTMVLPGESFSAPIRAVITSGGLGSGIMDGTVVTNEVPNSNMYADIDTVGNAAFDVTTDPVSFDVTDGDFWRVGDMMRCQAEVVQITEISGNTVTVNRGMLGTSAVAHGDGETLRLQFSNDYHHHNKYSVCQTNSDGRFKATNFFGKGRSSSGASGIMPGSVSVKFYDPGYQALGISGLKSSTNSGLVASRTYYFSIKIDGVGTADALTFTVDSSNTNIGGNNGFINKFQAAIDALYYNEAANNFEKRAYVTLTDGDIRVTSGQRNSGSSIELLINTAGTDAAHASGGERLFDGTNKMGRFPHTVPITVPASFPSDVVYDPSTYTTSPSSVFLFDDGFGKLQGEGSGTINYENGAINMIGCPSEAEFVISCIENTAFCGKANTSDAGRKNVMADIYATSTSQKQEGKVDIRVR